MDLLYLLRMYMSSCELLDATLVYCFADIGSIMFHVVQILLHRPFVSYGHLQSVLPEVALDSFSTCAAAANRIAQYLESYNRVHSFKFVPFFLFYGSYVSATIHVRIAAQKHLDTDAFACLRRCLSVFDQNELNNPAVKKAKAVIQKLMDRMGVAPPENRARTPAASKSPQKETHLPPQVEKHPTSSNANVNALATPVTTPEMDLLQGWNLNDLDFDAILQSFGRPTPNFDGAAGANANLIASPVLLDQNINAPWSTSDMASTQAQGGPYDYLHTFGGSSMDDVLFGFNVSSREDDW